MAARLEGPGVLYDVDEAFQLSATDELIVTPAAPDLVEVGGQQSFSVVATYFDTVDGRLGDAGIEVRREVGSDAAGWYLSIVLADGVHVRRAALGRSERAVPIQFRRLVWIITRGAVLQPVALLSIDREIRQFGRDGTVVVEVGLDRVTGRRLPWATRTDAEATSATATWSQLTVWSGGADQLVGKRVDRQLRRSGATRSSSPTPLAHRLAATAPRQKGAGRKSAGKNDQVSGVVKVVKVDKAQKVDRPAKVTARQRFSGLSPAGAVVAHYLGQELETLIGQDVPVRLDRPDSLHQMRVATRRLRSALQTFHGLFLAELIEPLEAELKWLAGELGRARDAEVLRVRLLEALSAQQFHQPTNPAVVRSVDTATRQSQRTAFAAVIAALDSERYRLLVAGLEALVADPPHTERGARPARKQLRHLVAETYLDVRRALVDATAAAPGPARDEQLHAARKAAKRARYAAEAVRPAFGKEAKAFAAAMERLQDVLGDYNDSVIMRARLHELALADTPAAAFALGRLHALQGEQLAVISASMDRAAAAAEKKSLRGWLT